MEIWPIKGGRSFYGTTVLLEDLKMKLLPAIIILAAAISLSMGSLKNLGRACYTKCKFKDGKSGKCWYCGTQGLCCRAFREGGGCTGRIGGAKGHVCVDGRSKWSARLDLLAMLG